MNVQIVSFMTLLAVYQINGAVLLWSNHRFEISPLRSFTDEDFEELLQELGHPEVTLYKTSPSLLPEFKPFLDGYFTAYNPNGDISAENATEISGRDDLMELRLKQRRDGNVLSVLVIPNGRSKREVTSSSITPPLLAPVLYKTPKGPVFYRGKSNKNNYGLLYSSQPLLLKMNNSLLLGNTSSDMITVDTAKKDTYALNVKIRVEAEDNIVSLRFNFIWSNSYWSLTSVKVSDIKDMYYELNIEHEFSAPARFSYHCNGETLFSYSNGSNNVELYINDLQVQIDSNDGHFSDAYDCINFTTGPILSGLFVTTILAVGLIIGLVAISDIKTMDKFDNHKTKQLVITVSE